MALLLAGTGSFETMETAAVLNKPEFNGAVFFTIILVALLTLAGKKDCPEVLTGQSRIGMSLPVYFLNWNRVVNMSTVQFPNFNVSFLQELAQVLSVFQLSW